jgi:L-ascorbate 6-phosphate lactonase
MSRLMDDVRATQVASGAVALWWIGQAGYIMKTSDNKVLFLDAYLSGGNRRMVPPPLEPEEIACDYYLCTHNHADHADLETIKHIRNKDAITFVGPKTVVKSLRGLGISQENLCEVNVGDAITLNSITLRGTFCIPTDETVLDTTGFLLTTADGITLYHTGDTGFHDFLFYLSQYPIDVMLTCINGQLGNMDIDEAVILTRYLRPRVVIPNHYGMFAFNTADPTRFRGRLTGTRAEAACQILTVGERYVYTRP